MISYEKYGFWTMSELNCDRAKKRHLCYRHFGTEKKREIRAIDGPLVKGALTGQHE